MSWNRSKPTVEVRVTRFVPEIAPATAGLSDEDREAHRAKRAKECAKVEPAIDLDARQNALEYLDMPEWRLEELARKYAPEDAYQPDEVDDELECD